MDKITSRTVLLVLVTLALCGCQAIKQDSQSQPNPGQIVTGNWEFILPYDSTHNHYLESKIQSTSTPGTYKDTQGTSKLFILDQSEYLANPDAGEGYTFGTDTYGLTLTVNSTQQVQGTITQNGGSPITFSATAGTNGDTMTGTFNDGIGDTGQFTAMVAGSLDGSYSTSNLAISENISGNVISEVSENGSGNYDLAPPVGNFDVLASDIPEGGDGSVVFWNSTGVCTGNQCAFWRDVSSGNVWVLMNNATTNPATNQIVGILYPGK
jgi:hypothetical protein